MGVFDSSVWIALFAETDVHHERALAIFQNTSGVIYVPYVVIEEVASVLTYKHSKPVADNFIEFVRHDERIIVLDSSAEHDMNVFLQNMRSMSFADISIMALASRLGATLTTFDEEMAREFTRAARSL